SSSPAVDTRRAADNARATLSSMAPNASLPPRSLALALIAVLAIGLVFAVSVHRGAAPAAAARSPSTVRRSVAILGFRNQGGEPQHEWVSTAVSEMLAIELG